GGPAGGRDPERGERRGDENGGEAGQERPGSDCVPRTRAARRGDQRSNPTLSTRRLASARWRAISVSWIASTLSVPSAEMIGCTGPPGLTGYSKLASAETFCASAEPRYSSSRRAAARFGEFFATAAPETFTCVPPFWKVGSTTSIALPHFTCSGPPAPLRIRPT